MKKLLLTLAGAIALTFSASATEPITTDFFNVEGFSDPGNTPVSKTIDGVNYTFMGSYVSTYTDKTTGQVTDSYLFIKGKTTKGAYFTVELPFDCSKIVLTTTKGCSTNAKSAVNFYAGETKLTTTVLNAQNAEFTFLVPEANATKGTVYKFESNTASYNQQVQKITFYPVTSEASISIDDKILSFVTVLNGEQTLSFKANASNISGDLTVTSSNPAFTIEKSTVTADEAAEGISVTFKGTSTDVTEGTITVAAGTVSAEIDVEGFAVDHAGTESDPLTVSDVLTMNNLNAGPFYVVGTIGDLCAANAKDGMVTEVADASKNGKTNIILKEGDKMIGVALPTGESRDKLNIVDNPTNAGKTVVILGSLEAYFSAPGVKNAQYVSGLGETGIDNITADSNATTEYYNLQGVRVANPENGLYIRRQGNTVTKVFVK